MADCRVLVVDDDQDTCEAIVELLRMEGYDAESACDGKQALDLLQEGRFRPDVIVLDLYMPAMSGHDLRAELKKIPEYAQVPIIVCSGSAALTSPEGFFDRLQKPMDIDALLGVVRRGCQSRPAHRRSA